MSVSVFLFTENVFIENLITVELELHTHILYETIQGGHFIMRLRVSLLKPSNECSNKIILNSKAKLVFYIIYGTQLNKFYPPIAPSTLSEVLN